MVNQKYKHIIYFFLFTISIISCQKTIKVDPNYSFGYEDLSDSYDSKNNTFTRKYSDDTIKIKIVLEKNEKEKILQVFMDSKFQNLPHEIDCSKWGEHPIIYDKLYLNGERVVYIHNINKSFLCPSGSNFEKINNILKNIISKHSEVKNLEPSDIAYE